MKVGNVNSDVNISESIQKLNISSADHFNEMFSAFQLQFTDFNNLLNKFGLFHLFILDILIFWSVLQNDKLSKTFRK